ncbi:MAG: glutamyl-tRNA reductase [Proteobacteria bacterium]|nr:glutamyl-tRNA reductase [Pseudomonadota bacterium]
MNDSSDSQRLARLVIVGVNHRTTPLDVREQLMLADPDQDAVLAALAADGLSEAALIMTCDRIELVALEAAGGAANLGFARLERAAGLPPGAATATSYRLQGEAALHHLFRVAASLDAQVVGEPQVLGQVKAAQRRAADAGALGAGLEAVFAASFAAAKQVRSETTIGQRPVSLAACAVQLVRDLHGDLGPLAALLVGAGEVGEYLAAAFHDAGLARFTVATRSDAQARALAGRLQAHRIDLETVPEALAGADVVITALGSGRILVAAPAVRTALRRRRQRPMFFLDCGLPEDVDAAVDALDQAFVYRMVDLESVAMSGRADREAALGPARAIVDQAVAEFVRARAARAAVPTVVAMREHFEAMRRQILAGAAGADADSATRALINRLLHTPSEVLREAAGDGSLDRAELERLVRRLFGLRDEENKR